MKFLGTTLALCVSIFAGTVTAASPILGDSATGVTCQYWNAGAKEAWLNQGGDWIDGAGVAQGPKAYTSQVILDTDRVSTVEWDVTALVASWGAPEVFRGILVQRVPNQTMGKITFSSREGSNPPQLTVRYKDGTTAVLSAAVDAAVACPWSTALGTRTTYTVDGSQKIVMAFDTQRRSDIEKATLAMTTTAQYGQTSVGTYQLRSPGMPLPGSTPGTNPGPVTTSGQPPVYDLYDGPTGMTCQHMNRFAELTWEKPGGDWIDAKGVAFGPAPFSQQSLPDTDRVQTVSWDVTGIVKSWGDPRELRGLMLRSSGTTTGTIKFSSREGVTPPQLTVRYADNTTVTVVPTADTYTGCPAVSPLGNAVTLNVSSWNNTIIGFGNVQRRTDVVQATLTLTSNAQFGVGTIGAYRLRSGQTPVGPVELGIASAYRMDVGLENHPDVIKVERFENPDYWRDWANNVKPPLGDLVSSDPALNFVPMDGKSLRVRIVGLSGVSLKYLFSQHGLAQPQEAYFRYEARFSPNYRDTPDGGKLPGLSGDTSIAGQSGAKVNGTNGWSLRGHFFPSNDPQNPVYPRVRLGTYAYHADMTQDYGDAWAWPNQHGLGLAELNRWYSIEQYVKMNTPGLKDGILRVWIDGQLAYERLNVNLRTVPGWPIYQVFGTMHYGGQIPTPHELDLWVDNMVIARRYIGPVRRN